MNGITDMDMSTSLVVMRSAYSFIITIIVIVSIITTWKIFTKAGVEGWKSIIPIYGHYCLFEIAFGNGWWFLIAWIPGVGSILLRLKLAKAFGKGIGFAIGLILLPFIFQLLLGFGSAEYEGPASIFD